MDNYIFHIFCFHSWKSYCRCSGDKVWWPYSIWAKKAVAQLCFALAILLNEFSTVPYFQESEDKLGMVSLTFFYNEELIRNSRLYFVKKLPYPNYESWETFVICSFHFHGHWKIIQNSFDVQDHGHRRRKIWGDCPIKNQLFKKMFARLKVDFCPIEADFWKFFRR